MDFNESEIVRQRLCILDELSNRLRSNGEAQRALPIGQKVVHGLSELYRLAPSGRIRIDLAIATLNLALTFEHLLDGPQALVLIDDALSLGAIDIGEDGVFQAFTQKARVLRGLCNRPIEAKEFLAQVLESLDGHPRLTEAQAYVYIEYATCLSELTEREQARRVLLNMIVRTKHAARLRRMGGALWAARSNLAMTEAMLGRLGRSARILAAIVVAYERSGQELLPEGWKPRSALSWVMQEMGSYELAEQHTRRVIRLLQSRSDPMATLETMRLAEILLSKGDLESAADSGIDSMCQMLRSHYPVRALSEGAAVLARIFSSLKEFDSRWAEKVEAIVQHMCRSLDVWSGCLAHLALRIARVMRNSGDEASARTLAEEVLRKAQPGIDDRLWYLSCLEAASFLNDNDKVISIYHSCRHLEAGDELFQLQLDHACASSYRQRGRLPEALELITMVVRRRSELLEHHDHDLQMALLEMGLVLKDLGDLETAHDYIAGALNELARSAPEHDRDVLKAKHSLAHLLIRKRRSAAAEVLLLEVVRDLQAFHPEDSEGLAQSTLMLAIAMLRENATAKALAIMNDLEDKWKEREQITEFIIEPFLSMNQSICLGRLGRYAEALSYSEKCLRIAESRYPPWHEVVLGAIHNMRFIIGNVGIDDVAQRHIVRVRQLSNDAINRWKALQRHRFGTLSPESHARAQEDASYLISGLLSCKSNEQSSTEEFEAVVQLRGLTDRYSRLNEIIRRHTSNDALRHAFDSLAEKRKVQTAAIRDSKDNDHIDREVMALERDLLKAVLDAPEADSLLDDVALWDLLKCLPEHSVAILVERFYHLEKNEHRWTGFIGFPNGSVSRKDLGADEEVAEEIRLFLGEIKKAFSEKGYQDNLRKSAEHVPAARIQASMCKRLSPLLDAIPEGTKELRLIPSGAFASLPWDAVWCKDSYLGDKYQIIYLENLTSIALRPVVTSDDSLLTIGGVDYGAGGEFASLPWTSTESESIQSSFVKNYDPFKMVILVSTNATREEFERAIPNKKYVHVATHGWIEKGIDEDHNYGGFDQWEGPLHTNRSRQTGLVFAGANRGTAGPWNNSILTAAEVLRLDLSGCELADLSACVTNVGPRLHGEALGGLARSFHLAGARNVCASLWTVTDDGTRALKREFYQQIWENNLSPPEALRKARKLIRDRMNAGPAIWAAFTLYVSGQPLRT